MTSETTRAPVSQPGFCPAWRSVTTWPQIQPVSAPNAPVSERDQEEGRRRPGPTAAGCAAAWSTCRARPGRRRQLGRRRRAWRCGAPSRSAASSWWCSSTATSCAAASSRPRNGPAASASRPRGPCWTTRPASRTATCSARSVVESRWATRMPVRPRDQPLGGPDDPGLGDRVHAGGGLVEHDDADVAHEQPGERDELLLARGEAGAARAEQGVQPVGQPGHPRRSRPSSATARLDVGARGTAPKSVMFSASVPARISVRWVTTPTAARSCCRSRSSTSAPPSRTVPRSRLDGAGEQRGQRRLAGAGAPDQRAGVAGGHDEVDVLEREAALVVGEVQVAELHVERARRAASPPPTGSRSAAEHARAAGAPRRSPPAGRAGAARAGRPGRRTSW